MRARPSSPPLPAYLNALAGKGVHVVTVNDYLAEYQSELMGRVHRFLGLETGCILADDDARAAPRQYATDITYGTNNEFGFDYLRDNMAWSTERARPARPQLRDRRRGRLDPHRRGPHAADHLRPGRPADQVVRRVRQASSPRLERGELESGRGDYEVDEKKRTVGVLERGIEKVEDHLGIENLYESANTPLVGYLNNAIKAKELFKNDKDYVVMNGEVLIVDEHTGRMLAGRRYNEGMHQAIEAKEGVRDQGREPDPRHDHPAELLPPLRQALRHDRHGHDRGRRVQPDLQARRRADPDQPADGPHRPGRPRLPHRGRKFEAVVDDIAERHEKGQPVLVGTVSVEKSEYLSSSCAEARRPARGAQRQAARA